MKKIRNKINKYENINYIENINYELIILKILIMN